MERADTIHKLKLSLRLNADPLNAEAGRGVDKPLKGQCDVENRESSPAAKNSGGIDHDRLVMSQTNHYWICNRTTPEGFCWCSGRNHKPTREILGRRNWKRKTRWEYGLKRNMTGPPRWWWKAEHARARRIYKELMFGSDDPVLPRERDLIDLWGWY